MNTTGSVHGPTGRRNHVSDAVHQAVLNVPERNDGENNANPPQLMPTYVIYSSYSANVAYMSHSQSRAQPQPTYRQPTMPLHSARDIGGYACERRKYLGITQDDLARKIGVSSRWIIRFEGGNPGANLASVTHVFNELGITLLGSIANK